MRHTMTPHRKCDFLGASSPSSRTSDPSHYPNIHVHPNLAPLAGGV